MRIRHTLKAIFRMLALACACLAAMPVRSQNLQQHCQWGVGTTSAVSPMIRPRSNNVIMMPTVMDFYSPPSGVSQIAFISYQTANQIQLDGGGSLRIIDGNCREIATFPNSPPCPASPLPPNCPTDFFITPHLAPASGLAVGNVDWNPDVEIIAVIDRPNTSDHKQIAAFNLVGSCLKPKWCSAPLASNDVIPYGSAPALAQLDQPGQFGGLGDLSEIIIDNKVYTGFGGLRYSGFSVGGNNCGPGSGAVGGLPCPRSRTVAVANLLGGTALPQMITGRGLYQSNPLGGGGSGWTGSLGWSLTNTVVSKSQDLYLAVADLDQNGTPEIVVSDWNVSKLRVLSPSGATLAWERLPVYTPGDRCGGPPMIGNADGAAGPEIGVASCNRYTLYKFAMGGLGTPAGSPGTLTLVWSSPISDRSGTATSTLAYTPDPMIYYADEQNLHVFNGPNGQLAQPVIPNTSGTGTEGPVIAALDSTMKGRVIVVANAHWLPQLSGIRGVRIFHDVGLGPARPQWNQHTYHVTNITNNTGVVPVNEQPSWLTTSPAHNTYRVQWP